MATIRDVASRAGVSIASVSRAFHNDPRVRPETRRLILKASEELGYKPSLTARVSSPEASRSIGIIMYDIDNPWYMLVARCMEKALRKERYNIIIMFDDDARSYEEDCLLKLAAAGVDGIMFRPLNRNAMPTVQALRARGISFLQLLTQLYEDITSVLIDDDYGSLTAIRYLLSKGYRRILALGTGPTNVYRQAHQEYGLEPDNTMCYETFNLDDPYDTVYDAIASKKPDAIFTWADKTSRCVIRALKEMHLAWPEDLGLLVYDDLPWVSMMNITAIAQPVEVVADTAVGHMLHIIRNKDDRGLAQSSIKPFLIERGSTV
jgi:DNA-binding LacI/PurR family transcriptional regulator